MMNHDSKRSVTLEDILSLKRAERPPAEFWTQFDRELRAKQLAALVEKRPWWRTMSFAPYFAGLRRFHLPLGAAAVLAVTVFSVREYRHDAPQAVPASGSIAVVRGSQPEAAVGATSSVAVVPVTVSAEPAHIMPAASVPPMAQEASPVAARFVLSSDATPLGGLVQMIPVVGAPPSSEELSPKVVPTTRLIASDFTALQNAETTLARELLNPDRGFETRALPSRNKPVEPLAQMKIPGASRRSYLIASATLASTTTPIVTTDRAARGLSDERLYDQVSRVNARGAGVLVKF